MPGPGVWSLEKAVLGKGGGLSRAAPLGAARGAALRAGADTAGAGLRRAGGRARARAVCHGAGPSTARNCRPGVLVLPAPAVSPAPARLGLMYRALYAFRSAEPNALAFAAGETFLVLERSSALVVGGAGAQR